MEVCYEIISWWQCGSKKPENYPVKKIVRLWNGFFIIQLLLPQKLKDQYAFKTEKNFKYYFFIALFFLILNILLKSTKLDYILYIIVTSGVLMAELANTAIEHVANAISGKYNEEIRLAKDIGSGIVLMQGFAFFIVEGIVFITKFV